MSLLTDVREFLKVLDPTGETGVPTIRVVQRTGVTWLGRTATTFKADSAESMVRDIVSEILVQKALTDPETLRKVVAHEVCHHVANWKLVANKTFIEAKRAKETELEHSRMWWDEVAKINARYGADFVNEKQESSYVYNDDGQTFYVLMKDVGDFISWCWTVRPSAKQRAFIENWLKSGAKLTMTTDGTLASPKARMGQGWVRPSTPETREKLKQLWESGPSAKIASASTIFNPQYMLGFLQEWYSSKDTKFEGLFEDLKQYKSKYPYSGIAYREDDSGRSFGWGTSWAKSREALEENFARPNAEIHEAQITDGVDLSAMAADVLAYLKASSAPIDSDVEQIAAVQEVVPLTDPVELKTVGRTAAVNPAAAKYLTWYHGSVKPRNEWTLENVGKEGATDQEGPGLYFTTSLQDAMMYGDHVAEVKLNLLKSRTVPLTGKVNEMFIRRLIKKAPDVEDSLTNWAENPNVALNMAASSIVEYSDGPHDAYQQVYADFYDGHPQEFFKALWMFDGVVVPRAGGTLHAIIYKPAIIKTIRQMKRDEILAEIEAEEKQQQPAHEQPDKTGEIEEPDKEAAPQAAPPPNPPAQVQMQQAPSPAEHWYMQIRGPELERRFGLVPRILLHLIEKESKGDPYAQSSRGAKGLFQIMPAAVSGFTGNPFDPMEAATYVAETLSKNVKQFGSYEKALAAWNWGRGNLFRKGLHQAPPETRDFLKFFKHRGIVG